jgi:hypothetical protein
MTALRFYDAIRTRLSKLRIKGRCQNLYYSMPRKARINQSGLTHHIMARTFDDLLLFRDDTGRRGLQNRTSFGPLSVERSQDDNGKG